YPKQCYLRDHFVDRRASIAIDPAPILPVISLELGNALGRILCSFKLTHDNIFYFIRFEEEMYVVAVNAVVKIANLGDALLHPRGHDSALLTLMPVPSDHARKTRVNGKARAPAIFRTVRFYN